MGVEETGRASSLIHSSKLERTTLNHLQPYNTYCCHFTHDHTKNSTTRCHIDNTHEYFKHLLDASVINSISKMY